MKYNMIKSIHITIWTLIITGLTLLILPYNSVTNGQQVETIQES